MKQGEFVGCPWYNSDGTCRAQVGNHQFAKIVEKNCKGGVMFKKTIEIKINYEYKLFMFHGFDFSNDDWEQLQMWIDRWLEFK